MKERALKELECAQKRQREIDKANEEAKRKKEEVQVMKKIRRMKETKLWEIVRAELEGAGLQASSFPDELIQTMEDAELDEWTGRFCIIPSIFKFWG